MKRYTLTDDASGSVPAVLPLDVSNAGTIAVSTEPKKGGPKTFDGSSRLALLSCRQILHIEYSVRATEMNIAIHHVEDKRAFRRLS